MPYHLPKVYVIWKNYRCILIFSPGFHSHRTAIYLGCTILCLLYIVCTYYVYYLPLLEEETPFSNLYMFLIERQSQVQWRTKGGMEWNRMIKPCFMHLFFADGYLLSSASLISSNLFLCSYYILYTEDAENIKA